MPEPISSIGNGIKFVVLIILLVGLPILGLIFSGNSFEPYLEFPPRTQYIIHSTFSWPTFILGVFMALPLFGALLFYVISKTKLKKTSPGYLRKQPFPWWGWIALSGLVVSWILAWTRYSWFSEFQTLTFTPLWVSFILLINAHTYSRTGHCLLLTRPRFFLILFLLSALFWWYFEFLNRFVQNWRYIGIEEFSPLAYFIHSTIAFSTVLPAVFCVLEWLQTFPHFQTCRFKRRLLITKPRPVALVVLIVSSVTLFGIGLWPNYLYFLLWVSPLLVMVSLQVLFNEPTFFSPLKNGDWRVLCLPALAALICGFFWEMWNYYSMAKWIYSISFVHGYQIFEMPVLGYMGYLPFGLECLVAVNFFSRPGSAGNAIEKESLFI